MSHDNLKIGQLVIDPEATRDAIHVAVTPVTAGETLFPGMHIGIDSNGLATTSDGKAKIIGIVDPFLITGAKQGQKFWMFLYPNTITSMRHQWTHPVLDKGRNNAPTGRADPYIDLSNKKSLSEAWLRDWAERYYNGGYDYLLEKLQEAIKTGGAYAGDEDDQERFNEHKIELLHNASIILDLPNRDNPEDVYFSCAC